MCLGDLKGNINSCIFYVYFNYDYILSQWSEGESYVSIFWYLHFESQFYVFY